MLKSKKTGAVIAAAISALGAGAIATMPAGATHQNGGGGHAQSVKASLTAPTFVNDLFVCAPDCKSHRVGQTVQEIRGTLDYVLATSSHLPSIVAAAGSAAFTCPANSATPGSKVPGLVMSISDATLFRNSKGLLKIELVHTDGTVQEITRREVTPNSTGEPVPSPMPQIMIGNCLKLG